MKWLPFVVGLLLLGGCANSFPGDMTWKEYSVSRHALHVVYNRVDVIDCEELGSVSGRSYGDVAEAKEKAISAAVLLQADHLLIDEIVTDVDFRSAYLPNQRDQVQVYGTAYRCGECKKCVTGRK